MLRSKRTWAFTGVAAAAAMTLAACSSGGSDETPSDGGEGGLSGEVSVWVPTQEESQATAWEALVDGFNTTYPDVTIVTETRQVDPHKDALRQAAGTSAGPDIYWYWEGSGLGGELVDVGMSKDLTAYYEQYGWEDRFTGAALGGITQYGGFHGVPWTQQGEAIFYNKALFAQAGITELPTTYDGLVEAAEQLKAAGITPIEFGGTVNWHVMRLLDALVETKCGADKADELTKGDGDWGAEACVTEAFTELKTWGDEYINDGFMAMSNDDSSLLFYSGDAAMAFEGTWFESNAYDGGMDPENVGIFMFPTETGRLYGFGEGFYITETSDNPDAAAAFLDYITSTEGQDTAGNAWAALSVNADVDRTDASPLAPSWISLFNDATGVYMNNDQNFSTQVTTEYWRIHNAVLVGDIDPADAGAEFQKFRAANQ
ncbi:extracellular solute-binding protein [Demequina sp. SYSU T00068]|uniref:ABC transporter substrate-binding protein n=1 Tax=Demequina lignilytica TaxID=3051663 RepID=UPI00261CA47C|nr:extracellular solute-binding protein [Demequina sp. SYSU T00068]MDN4491646.1 extracellular solute-binding protein [Demequina sp. SYSU T00068]